MKISLPTKLCLLLPLALLTGCPSEKRAVAAPPTVGTPESKGDVAPEPPPANPPKDVVTEIPRGQNHVEGFDPDVLQFTDQGSGFFPMSIVQALNDSKTGKPYLENLERFGLVPGAKSKRNPKGFPVGIVTNIIKNEGDGREIEMFGFTCAACHTSDFHYKGQTVRVDGGAGGFYVDALGDQIGASLKATLENPDEFLAFLRRYARYAQLPGEQLATLDKLAAWEKNSPLSRVLRSHLDEGAKDLLARIKGERTAEKPPETHENFLTRVKQLPEVGSLLSGLAAEESALAEKLLPDLGKIVKDLENVVYRLKFLKTRNWFSSDPAHRLAAGYGRADDFGTARVELFGAWNPEKNMLPVNAPVSVPPLWNVDKYAWLHWNSNTNSVIQRSIGEALGVGATYNAETGDTSVAIFNQMKIEEQVQKLAPPEWPTALFGAPAPDAVKRGKEVYQANCAKCHDPKEVDGKGLVHFQLSTLAEVRTDSLDAESFDRPVFREDGSTVGFAASIKSLLDTLQEKAKSAMSPEDKAFLDRLEKNHAPAVWRDTLRETGGPVYPARPLEGVWATPPYLHNGSVPTLYHLLFPDERPQKFSLGQKDFDPVKVGFEIDPAKINPQPDFDLFEFDTNQPGNRNAGHDSEAYGTKLPREDRLALIEYLKVHHDAWPAP